MWLYNNDEGEIVRSMQIDKEIGLELVPTGSLVNNGEYIKDLMNVLYDAYVSSIKGSKWKGSSQLFSLYYLKNIFQIVDNLENLTLSNEKTRSFNISERGKNRLIVSLPVKDRVIRHVLCDDILMPAVRNRIIYDNGASVKGRGIAFTRKRLETHLHKYYKKYGNEGYILLSDFTKFYDNIVHEISKNQFLELYDFDPYLNWLLDEIFNGFDIPPSNFKHNFKHINGIGVNIGDQLSQTIGIYYPNTIDQFVKTVCSQKFYGRYMDDLYLMSPDKKELIDIFKGICEIADDLGIIINRRKTCILKLSSVFTFLQIRYTLAKNGKIIKRINPKRVYAMRRKLKKLSVFVGLGMVDYKNVENMFKSWMGGFYKIMSKSQRRNMILLYEDLFDVKIYIEKKHLIIDHKMHFY